MTELLAPMALTAAGTVSMLGAGTQMTDRRTALQAEGKLLGLTPGTRFMQMEANEKFDPVKARNAANSIQGRVDNLPLLKTVNKDPKYALTEASMSAIDYDQKNRGNSHLENQWFYSNLTKDSETPMSMGYLPEYKRSTGLTYRGPDTPDMLKPKKREVAAFKVQPETDRRFYEPVTGTLAGKARYESKMASGNGALNGFMMNDRPGNLGGPTEGFSTGMYMTRKFTGYHPQQRFFRQHDNQRGRNPHGLRAGLKNTTINDTRGDMMEFRTNGKDQQLATLHREPVGLGGRHNASQITNEEINLRYVQRDTGL